MDLNLSQTERDLAASARAFIESEVTDVVPQMGREDTGTRPQWERAISQSGWSSLFVSSQYGGVDATALETAVVFEEFGRGPLPPLPLMCAAAAGILGACDGLARKDEILGGMAEGSLACVPAGLDLLFVTGHADDRVKVARKGKSWSLNGVVPAVAFAGSADHLLVILPAGQHFRVLCVPSHRSGVSTRLLGGFLAWHYEVSFDDVVVPDADVAVSDAATLVEALRPAMLYLSAYSVGGCARSLEMSRRYCDERVQFGQPIGKFQRVQDHVIHILNVTDRARWSLYEALWRRDAGLSAEASVHLAKAVASDGYWEAANAAHEVHAGIGSDPLFGLASYSRMSRTLFHVLGPPRWHKRQMIALVVERACADSLVD